MNLQHRHRTMSEQKRSYTVGTVELINEQWIFFDDENEEASLLEELVERDIEVLTMDCWQRGSLTEDGYIQMPGNLFKLEHGSYIRVPKILPYAYNELLNTLTDDTFSNFTLTLNKLKFSLYDCLHCHNFMLYHPSDADFQGVNFMTYDNSETVCAVQHHFKRGKKPIDRFEFTIADGERSILTSF